MTALFSKERVNTGRQLEVDLAKVLAIVIVMLWTHTYETLSTEFEPSLGHFMAYVLGSVAGASTFMFCMGIGLSYTTHNSSKDCLQRGFNLLTTGFVLQIFKDIIPPLLCAWIYNDPDTLVFLIFGVCCDILFFAGLAFLLTGLLKRWGIGKTGILLISVAMSVAGTLLEGVSTGCYAVDQLLGFFWGTYSDSYFPLFNWFIFVAAGQWFGDKYQFLQNKKKFHAISLLVGAVLCAAYFYLSFNVDQQIFKGLTDERFLAHRPFTDALVCIPVNIALISLLYFIGQLIPQKAVPALTHPSAHINQYYCVSWVIISLAEIPLVEAGYLTTDLQVIAGWVIITAATILGVVIYNRYIKKRTDSFFGRHRAFWTILVWAICISAFIWALCNFDTYPNFLNGDAFGF